MIYILFALVKNDKKGKVKINSYLKDKDIEGT